MNTHKHARNLRKGRVSEPGRIYLVTTVTRKRRPIFENLCAARILIRSLHHPSVAADSLSFVVMPDHLHWLLQLPARCDCPSLASVVGRIKSFSAQRINRYLGCAEPLWLPGFHDHALRHDEDVRRVGRYIVANPLRGGLVDNIEDYPHWDAVWL